MTTVKEMETALLRWKHLYYAGMPEVSDTIYDEFEEKLRKIDPNNPVLSMVGYDIKDGIKHKFPMRSIQKALTPDELASWWKNTCRDKQVVISYKMDGLALSLIYKNGILSRSVTRGDGEKGEDVTKNVMYIESIPKIIPALSTKPYFEVRGEVYMCKSVFNKFAHLGYTDERNLAVGSLKCSDPKVTKERSLSFKAYKVCDEDYFANKASFRDELILLKHLGFDVVEYAVSNDFTQVISIFDYVTRIRESLDYKIDGIVVYMDDNVTNATMGATDHHPRYAACLKFEAVSVTTTVERIDWSMSRNGTLTPVAVFKPVLLAGANITCAKAHNLNFLMQNNINVGNNITIVRSGDVIPKILYGDKDLTKVNVVCDVIPKVCPYCKAEAKIIKEVNTYTLKCTNDKCYKRVALIIEHYCKEVGIKGLGEATIENAVAKGCTEIEKLYTQAFLNTIESKVIAAKIKEETQKTYGIEFSKFLAGMGIPEFTINSINKWLKLEPKPNMDTFPSEHVKVAVGQAAYEVIKNYYTPEVAKSIKALMCIVKPKMEVEEIKTTQSSITGKKICITGTLSISRPEMANKLKSYGAIIVGSVSSKTDILLAGENAGSKKDTATSLNVKIMSEEELLRSL